jgi:peroxiredoxin
MKPVLHLKPGDRLPDLTVPDQQGRPVTLPSIAPGALFIYPAADTPG